MDEEIRKTLEDPVLFFAYITDMPPFIYQIEFLKAKEKRIALRSGRQIGKSLVVAVKALWQAINFTNQKKIGRASCRERV